MTVRCVACGKFIPYAEMVAEAAGAKFYFEPASHSGPELSEWTCAACTMRETRQPAGELPATRS